MDALLVGAVVMAVVAGGLAIAFVRTRARLAEAVSAVTVSEGNLRRERASSSQGRAVQDLILASMEEGVLLFGDDGQLVFANASASRHLGSTPDRVDALLPTGIQRAVKRAGFTGATVSAEVDLGAPPRWLRATAIHAGDDGEVLLVVRDVTDARRLDEVRRDFVANASHELKTPVASIQAAAETIRTAVRSDPPAALRFTEQLETESLRLSRIVSDLLDLSRLETGSDVHHRVRLDEIASDEVERLRSAAHDASVELVLDIHTVPSVDGSPNDLSLMVRNLIDNAIRATPPGGSVRVRVWVETDGVRVRISDTGVGIPSRDLPRIFERFYRVDRARSRETGGTGLGLAIVRHVVENHGGQVSVSSELGQGSEFDVVIPMSGG